MFQLHDIYVEKKTMALETWEEMNLRKKYSYQNH